MGQQEVFIVLKKKKDYISAEEIADILQATYGSVLRALSVMLRYGEVERKESRKELREETHITRRVYVWRLKIE